MLTGPTRSSRVWTTDSPIFGPRSTTFDGFQLANYQLGLLTVGIGADSSGAAGNLPGARNTSRAKMDFCPGKFSVINCKGAFLQQKSPKSICSRGGDAAGGAHNARSPGPLVGWGWGPPPTFHIPLDPSVSRSPILCPVTNLYKATGYKI